MNLKQRLGVTVNASQVITLDASATSDPDGDRLAFEWWVYREAGDIEEDIDIDEQDSLIVVFRAPRTPGELHVVLTVRDDGDPPLERYGRCVITIAQGAVIPRTRFRASDQVHCSLLIRLRMVAQIVLVPLALVYGRNFGQNALVNYRPW